MVRDLASAADATLQIENPTSPGGHAQLLWRKLQQPVGSLMTFAQARRYALSLPETIEAPHFDRTSFRVRGKIFVTAQPQESHIHVFLPQEILESAIAMDPENVSPLHWGKKIVGLRVELAGIPLDFARDLIRFAWESKAPQSLVRSKRMPGS